MSHTYNDKIVKAHDAWKKAEDKIPEAEHKPSYKSRSATAKRLWKLFDTMCEAEGVKAIDVSMSFLPKTMNINMPDKSTEKKIIPMHSKPANKFEYQEYGNSWIITNNGKTAVTVYFNGFQSKEDAYDNMILIIDSLK